MALISRCDEARVRQKLLADLGPIGPEDPQHAEFASDLAVVRLERLKIAAAADTVLVHEAAVGVAPGLAVDEAEHAHVVFQRGRAGRAAEAGIRGDPGRRSIDDRAQAQRVGFLVSVGIEHLQAAGADVLVHVGQQRGSAELLRPGRFPPLRHAPVLGRA